MKGSILTVEQAEQIKTALFKIKPDHDFVVIMCQEGSRAVSVLSNLPNFVVASVCMETSKRLLSDPGIGVPSNN